MSTMGLDATFNRIPVQGLDLDTADDTWEPEHVVFHKRIADPAESMEWGITPGEAVCGFRFTANNYVGPGAAVAGDPRFIIERCQPCENWFAMARVWVDNRLDELKANS